MRGQHVFDSEVWVGDAMADPQLMASDTEAGLLGKMPSEWKTPPYSPYLSLLVGEGAKEARAQHTDLLGVLLHRVGPDHDHNVWVHGKAFLVHHLLQPERGITPARIQFWESLELDGLLFLTQIHVQHFAC